MRRIIHIPTGRAAVLLEETIISQRYAQQVAHGRRLRDAGQVCPLYPESVVDGWLARDDELFHDEIRAALRGDVDPEAETVRLEKASA